MTASASKSLASRLLDLIPGALPDIREVLARFPLPALIAGFYTLYLLFGAATSALLPAVVIVRLPLIAEAGFLASLGGMLLGEARGWAMTRRLLAGGIGLAAVVLLVAIGYALDLVWIVLVLALALGVGLAPYLRSGAPTAAYWLFNHQLWIAAGVAGTGAVLFAGGVSLILVSLHYLFGLTVPAWLYEKVWIIALALIAPVTWLDLVPDKLDAEVTQGPQIEFTSQSVAVLVRFLMVPLLLVYAAILHVYALKIFFTWSLPRGQIGWMVMSYGAVMALTALLAFPTRDVSGPLVRLFWRIWPLLLPVPVLLLLIAAVRRIGQYGITEPRYMLLAGALWLLAVAGLQIWPRTRGDVRAIVVPLALIAFLASFGPWGMLGSSVRSQASRLIRDLEAVGRVKSGRITGQVPQLTALKAGERDRIASGFSYLVQRNRLGRIAPLFAGAATNPFATRATGETSPDRFRLGNMARYAVPPAAPVNAVAVTKAMGLADIVPGMARFPGRIARYFSVVNPTEFTVDSPHRLVGPVYANSTQRETKLQLGEAPSEFLSIELVDSIVTVKARDERFARFDVAGARELQLIMETPAKDRGQRRAPVRLARLSGDLDVALLVVSAGGYAGESGQTVINTVSVWLELPR